MNRHPTDRELEARLRRDAAQRLALLGESADTPRDRVEPSPAVTAAPRPVLHRLAWATPLAATAAVVLLVLAAPWRQPEPPAAPDVAALTRGVTAELHAWRTAWRESVDAAEGRASAASAVIDDAPRPAALLDHAGRALTEPYRREWRALSSDLTEAFERVTGRSPRPEAPGAAAGRGTSAA